MAFPRFARGLCAAACLGALMLSAVACEPRTVARSASGEVYQGRYIPARAYEAYARGVLFESEGKLADAAEAFRAATELDAEGPEPWTRLGAVQCKRGQAASAEDAFEHATKRGADYAPLRRERGRCALARGDVALALAELRLAEILDPDDVDAAGLLADALAASKDDASLVRYLVAHVLQPRPPDSLIERLEELAAKRKDARLARLAEGARLDHRHRDMALPILEPAVALARVDDALMAGDLVKARRLSLRARLSAGELSLRAAALGKLDLAREQALLVSDADPEDASSRVALLVLGDVGAQPALLAEAARRGRDAPGTPALSPLGRLLLAETLRRRVGPDAAALVIPADERDRPRSDALEERVRVRFSR